MTSPRNAPEKFKSFNFILFSSGVDITEQKRIQYKNQRNTAHSEQKYELAIQK